MPSVVAGLCTWGRWAVLTHSALKLSPRAYGKERSITKSFPCMPLSPSRSYTPPKYPEWSSFHLNSLSAFLSVLSDYFPKTKANHRPRISPELCMHQPVRCLLLMLSSFCIFLSIYLTSESWLCLPLSVQCLAPLGPALNQQSWKSLHESVAPVQFLEGKPAAVCEEKQCSEALPLWYSLFSVLQLAYCALGVCSSIMLIMLWEHECF